MNSHRKSLWAIVFLGIALRLPGVFWGLRDGAFVGHHPDEWNLVALSNQFITPTPDDKRFNYPQAYGLVTAAVRRVDRALFKIPLNNLWRSAFLPGRLLSVAFGVATIIVVYQLGLAALLSPLAALMAALAVATSPLHVMNSHFMTADSMAVFVATLALLGLVKAARSGRAAPFLLGSAAVGVGIATKMVLAPVAGLLITGVLAPFGVSPLKRVGLIAAGLGAALAGYLIANGGMNAEMMKIVYGTIQVDNVEVKDHLKSLNPLIYAVILIPGMGLPMFAMALKGAGRQVGRLRALGIHDLNRWTSPEVAVLLVLAGVALVHLGLICTFSIPTGRHALLLVPLAALLAGAALDAALGSVSPKIRSGTVAALVAYQIVSAVSVETAFVKDQRWEAADWIRAHLQPAPIFMKHFTPAVTDFRVTNNPAEARYVVLDEMWTYRFERSPFNPLGPADCHARLFHATAEDCRFNRTVSNEEGYRLRHSFNMTPWTPEQWVYDRVWGSFSGFVGDIRIYEAVESALEANPGTK